MDTPETPRLSPSQQLLRWFDYEHLTGWPREIAHSCMFFAERMDAALPDGPEKTAGLRKLLEAKDCFMRAALTQDAGTEGR